MSFSIRLTTHAVRDLEAAKHWYNQQKDGLGALFISAVNKQFNELKSEAVLYRKVYGEVRKAGVRKFPFSIYFIYNFSNHAVDVIAVLHNRRDEQAALLGRTVG